jgi:MYXO-CTERM domain-containing protein
MVVRGGKGHPGWHLAWRVEARTAPPRLGDWYVFVSAESGRVVRAFDRLKRGGADCVPCNPAADPACGLVLFENPVDALDNPYLTNGSNVDGVQMGCVLTNLTSTVVLDGLYANTAITAPRAAPPYDSLRSAGQTALDEVNVYYHVNRAKEYLNSLGHTGVMSYSIAIDAHDGALGDNSYYSPADLELHFGEGGVDDAQDADVVYHEYGHAIQDDQVLGYGLSAEGGATGEGFGDYWAAAMTDDSACEPALGPACVAGWDAVSYNPYDGSVGSGCLRRLDGTKQYPEDFVWEVHADGEMWGAALWSLRGQVGGSMVDALVIQAHSYLTASADFIDAADGLLSADVALHGGAHAGAIHDAMRVRGLPRTATPAATTNMSSFAAYSCSTSHSYANWEYTECSYTVPGADRVRFRFSIFNTESGWDYVYISDPDYLQVERLSGNLGSNVLSAAVSGDTIVARFKADGSVRRYGFDIDRVYYSAPTCIVDADCDDGNPCNGVETCHPVGGCQSGPPPSCDDGNPCTDDFCDAAAGGCRYVNNAAPCSDGNACTAGDQCAGGICVGGPPLSCDDGNPCNGVETCHPAAGCQPGVPLNCSDGDPCTFDSCHPATGCTHQPICGDAGVPDGATPPPDGATPPPDGATPPPDGATPPPDGTTPLPDGGADATAPPVPDGVRVDSFSPRPGCSCSHPGGGTGPGLLLALGLLLGLRRRSSGSCVVAKKKLFTP